VKPFICRFAVGRDGLAYSSDWRIWTHRNKPDLYIAIRQLGGELKASVHAPHPPHHTGWRRHLGFQKDATSIVSKQAKQDGGPHKVQWPGCEIGPDTTVEYRIIIRGMSLEETGRPRPANWWRFDAPERWNSASESQLAYLQRLNLLTEEEQERVRHVRPRLARARTSDQSEVSAFAQPLSPQVKTPAPVQTPPSGWQFLLIDGRVELVRAK
jgi:hypothetical protein